MKVFNIRNIGYEDNSQILFYHKSNSKTKIEFDEDCIHIINNSADVLFNNKSFIGTYKIIEVLESGLLKLGYDILETNNFDIFSETILTKDDNNPLMDKLDTNFVNKIYEHNSKIYDRIL